MVERARRITSDLTETVTGRRHVNRNVRLTFSFPASTMVAYHKMTDNRARKAKGPQFIRFLKPIIEILRELGGSGTSSEVTDKVIERLNIPDEEQSVILKSGQSRVYNQVHWARMYLVNGGLLDSSKRGVWTLTE